MKKYIQLASVKVTISLFIVIAILCVVNEIYFNVGLDSYTSGSITELLGIIVTVCFVEYIYKKSNEREDKQYEINEIKRADKVMQLHIQKFIERYYEISTPINNRSGPSVMSDSFKLSDMCDLHTSSLDVNNGWGTSCAELFFEKELILRQYIIDMLGKINFKYNKGLEEVLIEFVSISISFNSSKTIIFASQRKLGDEPEVDFVKTALVEHGDKFLKQVIAKESYPSNLLTPYACLYIMMVNECNLINRYSEIVKAL